MRFPAVHFDDQVLRASEEIHFEAIHLHVHLRPGQTVATDNLHEQGFQIGSRAVRTKSITYREAQVLRLSKGSGELLAWKYPAEVLQRPGGPGHGDPMAAGAIGQ
jgi:hypothetical protein